MQCQYEDISTSKLIIFKTECLWNTSLQLRRKQTEQKSMIVSANFYVTSVALMLFNVGFNWNWIKNQKQDGRNVSITRDSVHKYVPTIMADKLVTLSLDSPILALMPMCGKS